VQHVAAFVFIVFSLNLVGCGGGAKSASLESPLSIPSVALGIATAGTPYSQTLSATGGTAPYSWSLTTGSFPTGIQLSSAGLVSGTTSQTGQFNLTVQVQDSSGLSATLALVLDVQAANGQGIANSFFGMNINKLTSPWPTTEGFAFGGYRTIASQILWPDINTANGVYDWTNFDAWIAKAQAGGQDILYTIYSTPAWASSDPTATCTGEHIGGCYPPSDLNSDGTGTDQYFQSFVSALMSHVGPGVIKYFEIWNEPNISTEWTGTNAQMLRLASDARTIIKAADPNALLLTPPIGLPYAVASWLVPYLQAGGGQYADVIGVHGYVDPPGVVCPSNCPVPETVAQLLADTRTAMATYGQASKPLFDTEGSWGIQSNLTDPAQEMAFTARFYLIQLAGTATAHAFDRLYWYGWDIQTDDEWFWDTDTNTAAPAGQAYQQIYAWVIGAALSPCLANGTQWTCGVSRPGTGYQALAIWDTSQGCSASLCATISASVDPMYVQYRDLSGKLTPITNSAAVPVGGEPILLENQNPN
jgi:polysaccharide biosynthesis protein PslG